MVLILLLLAVTTLLGGCGQLSYYNQAITGQWRLLEAREPVAQLLAEPDLNPLLRRRLRLAHQLRDFASRRLDLSDNGSYRSYVALDRPYVVWNVFAAPEFSVQPYRWCYLVIGCASYRGYYHHAAARREAERMHQRGYDVFVAGIPAYSTLGWFADPLLSSFISWPQGLLAELMFHELAHQKVYVDNDTSFNESFATAVGELGAARWLHGKPWALKVYRRYKGYQQDFQSLMARGRQQLTALYASGLPPTRMRLRKAQELAALYRDYRRLKRSRWDGFSGYDRWVGEGFNNAKIASLQPYTEFVPAFKALFHRQHNDFRSFYRAVARLAALPKSDRHQRLRELMISVG